MSSGEVTSNGSPRCSNGSFKVTGRAILPHRDADKPRTAKLRRALDASVTATGSWNDGMPPDRDRSTEGAWSPFYELSFSERERRRGLKGWTRWTESGLRLCWTVDLCGSDSSACASRNFFTSSRSSSTSTNTSNRAVPLPFEVGFDGTRFCPLWFRLTLGLH